jgi:hypothetical protein
LEIDDAFHSLKRGYQMLNAIRTLCICQVGVFLLLTVPEALAASGCSPRIVGAKILASRDIKDIHPAWTDASIGLGWSLVNIRQEGNFLSGSLVTTRGAQEKYRVFVLPGEWICS